MGVTSDEEGEPSQQSSNSDDRPMKKARYVWQIKGKYHLKQPGKEEIQRQDINLLESETENDDYSLSLAGNKDVADLSVELEKASVPAAGLSLNSGEDAATPSLISNIAEDESDSVSDSVSMTELAVWQERNVAKSKGDNAINHLLELMGVISLPIGEMVEVPAYEEDTDLEDEAVLMAIHSHGLQNQCEEDCSSVGRSPSPVPCLCRPQACRVAETQILNPFHRRAVACGASEVGAHLGNAVQVSALAQRRQCDSLDDVPLADVSWDCQGVSGGGESGPTQGGAVSGAALVEHDGVDMTEKCAGHIDESSSTLYDHFDFLDQAVAVAIRKKGLSTLSCSEFG